MQVSKLKFDDKSMALIVSGLAREAHEFALASGVPSESVEHRLPLVFSILSDQSTDLFDVINVATLGAPSLAAIRISLSDEGYRLLAEAAKDRIAGAINVDSRIA